MRGVRGRRGGAACPPVLALLPAGTLLAHAVAYRHSHGAASLPHDYLSPASWTAAVLAAVALAWYARRGADGGRARPPGLLLACQPALFVIQEWVEHLTAGHSVAQAAASSAVRWGLLLQLVTAALLIALSHLARATGRILGARAGRAFRRPPVSTAWPGEGERWTSAPALGWTSPRGPPASFVPA